MTAAEVHRIVVDAKPVEVEPPRPLLRQRPPAPEFAVDALGTILGDAARAIHDKVQAPIAMCAQSVLSAASLAVQGHGDVELPTRQRRPLSLFAISIGRSGERKSAADHEALRPIRRREQALRERHEIDRPAWENDHAAWKTQREQVQRDKKNFPSREAKRAALDELGPAPTAPLTPLLTCPDPTLEGLCKLLASGQPIAGLLSSEGGLFLGGHGMSPDQRLKTASGLSSFWDGEPVRRVRAGDGVAVLAGRRVCLHLMVQPDVADGLLSDPVLVDQGLPSRLLVVAPDSAFGTRFWHEPDGSSDVALDRYETRLLHLLETPLPLAPGKTNELEPRLLPLALDAQRMWIAFADEIERQVGPGGDLEGITGLANKLPEHAARIAGALTLVEDPHARSIEPEAMANGITLAKHYAVEALRLFEAGGETQELRLAQQLLDWLHTKWKEDLVSLPDIYQRGPNAVRDAKTAGRLVTILEDHGWLVRLDHGARVAGTPRRDVWRVVRP